MTIRTNWKTRGLIGYCWTSGLLLGLISLLSGGCQADSNGSQQVGFPSDAGLEPRTPDASLEEPSDGGDVDEAGDGGRHDAGGNAPPVMETTLRSPWPTKQERFGASVAVWGETVLIGAPGGASSETVTGAAYLFERDRDGAWLPGKRLLQGEAGPEDELGYSVAMTEQLIVVGAPFGRQQGIPSGTAFILERQGIKGDWTRPVRLAPEESHAYGFFGSAVATDGTRVVVGGMEMGKGKQGQVQVYAKREGAWMLEALLTANDAAPYAQFGVSVAISGDTLLVGADSDKAKGDAAGAAYVFVYRDGEWVQQAKLLASQGDELDFFGHAVDLQKDTAVVGAHLDEVGAGGETTGAVYVFSRRGDTWSEQSRILPSDQFPGGSFGISVALEGETLVVGSYQNGERATGAGAAYVFQKEGTAWSELMKLHPQRSMAKDEFGYCVDISETGLVVTGAPGADEAAPDSGALYLTRSRRSSR